MKRIFSAILTVILFATCFNVAALADESNYKLFTVDFQKTETNPDGFDSTRWQIMEATKSGSTAATYVEVVEDPLAATDETRANNTVLKLDDSTSASGTSYFHVAKKSSTYLQLDGKFTFQFDIYFPNSANETRFQLVNMYDHSPNESGGNAITLLGGSLLDTTPKDGSWALAARYYEKNDKSRTKNTKATSLTLDKWYTLRFDFDMATLSYTIYVDGTKVSANPYSFAGLPVSRLDRIYFPVVAGKTYYIDNIKVYQHVCADADVQGFYNGAGEEIDAVDPVKTVFKTKLINRTSSSQDTKLILVALNESETRLTEVRLISFADANSEKPVEEVFNNLGTGVKIKVMYLDGLTALAPETVDSTLKTFEFPAASVSEGE